MRKELTVIKSLEKFLTEARNVITEANEISYDELKKRDKRKIMKCLKKCNLSLMDGWDSGKILEISSIEELKEISQSIYFNYESKREEEYPEEAYFGQNGSNSIEEINNTLIYLQTIKDNTPPLAILNTSILTSAGNYTLTDISLADSLSEIENANGILSAVGHQSTAETLTHMLGMDICVNRIQFEQSVGQKALVFKLLGRQKEGEILSREDIEVIGYKFQLLERIK